MRLVTFATGEGHSHIGAVRDGHIVDLTVWLSGKNSRGEHTHIDMVDFISQGEAALNQALAALQSTDADLEAQGAFVPFSDRILLAPIPRPRKNVMCMGRNYAEHAAESVRAFKEDAVPLDKPDYPSIFTKAPTTVNGPFADIPYNPAVTEELDWEGELAVVIGKAGKNIKSDDAFSHVFGYMVLNDISARDIQKRHANQYFKGKSLDGACPTGPWIVTSDEIADPNNLRISLSVNGVEKQHDTTRSMLFDIPEIIEQMSFGMTLEPGDIIATGTPAGVGMARTPKEFLRPGDVVECEIESIGKIRNRITLSV